MGDTLAGRVVLVTGSSRGIGAEIVAKAAAEGALVAVHHRDLPLLDLRAAPENLGSAVANRLDPVRAGPHRILVLPGTGGDTPSGLPIDHHRQSDEAVELLERWQNLITDVGCTRVDRRLVRLNRCGTCVHGPPPTLMGGAPVAPPVDVNSSLTFRRTQCSAVLGPRVWQSTTASGTASYHSSCAHGAIVDGHQSPVCGSASGHAQRD